jgi:RNA polymerase sigma-70 factor (ECF subfamily)
MSLHPEDLAILRPHLLRFALLQLRNEALAEDAVSETLVAALENPERFSGRSSLKTYLIGILKHKIIDSLRSWRREVPVALCSDGEVQSDADTLDALFAKNGHYHAAHSDWGNPDRVLEQREFFDILQACVDRLPARTGRIFLMREWLGLETEEICQELEITKTHASVMLYRARMRLRECLELNWFGYRR